MHFELFGVHFYMKESGRVIFDYMIVGAGLFGSVFAYEATKHGKSCFVVERRNDIGGNCYTRNISGIDVHMYGAHIFKTDNKAIWDYINQFAEFNNFINTPIAICNGKAYNMPFNMNTFSEVFGVARPDEAQKIIDREKSELPSRKPRNLEEYAISKVGRTLYEMFIKGYTEKQWGKPCSQLPTSILSDIPVRFNYNNNYYDKRYQGVPMGGYTQIFHKMLQWSVVMTHADYRSILKSSYYKAKKLIYTGSIDKFFDYELGRLDYRSLEFKHEYKEIPNENGVAVMNYVDSDIPYTRAIEHKHFCGQKSDKTIVTYEYPKPYTGADDAYYPMNDDKNKELYQSYLKLAKERYGNSVIFGGRLGSYRYDDMAECIESSLELVRKELRT